MVMDTELGLPDKNDIVQILRIENESFSEPWSEASFNELAENKWHRIYCLKGGEDNAVRGYIGLAVSAPDAEITNLAVDKDLRGQGYGEKILSQALEMLKKQGVTTVFLEVRRSNAAARGLYEKTGFEEIGVRKNYYNKPREDAVVMKRNM